MSRASIFSGSERKFSVSLPLSVLICGGLLGVLVGIVMRTNSASLAFGATAAVAYVCAALGVFVCASKHLSAAKFGKANSVTLVRVVLVALLTGLFTETLSDDLLWLSVGVALTALLLDGIDGWLARRYAESSDFGARFDMETDAALILVLAGLAYVSDRVGLWILLTGLMRYGFVAAGRFCPRLVGVLPKSRRRQSVCVVQIVSLLLCLTPAVPLLLAYMIAAVGLVALCVSFAIDVHWLVRNGAVESLGSLTA